MTTRGEAQEQFHQDMIEFLNTDEGAALIRDELVEIWQDRTPT